MNGFLLLIPFLLVRFGLLSCLNKDAIRRAAYFPPVIGNEKQAYWIYQISNIALFLYLCFLNVFIQDTWQFYCGTTCYLLGLFLCAISLINFAKPTGIGFNNAGLYRFSRNPMYISYFICFLGCALLTQSILLWAIVIVFIVSSHWIILSEERWCIERFKDDYKQYMKTVSRYF